MQYLTVFSGDDGSTWMDEFEALGALRSVLVQQSCRSGKNQVDEADAVLFPFPCVSHALFFYSKKVDHEVVDRKLMVWGKSD